jgi:hypothetical protein
VKKFACLVVLGLAAAFVAPATSASADSVCAPITIDGQPVCQDITPVEQALAPVEQAIAAVEQAIVNAEKLIPDVGNPQIDEQCILGTSSARPDQVVIEVVINDKPGLLWCDGTEITVTPTVSVPTQPTHFHVPQVCVTTSNTCVGPVDQDVDVPTDPTASLTVCQTPVTVYSDGSQWRRFYTGDSTCTSVPSP